jgi:hypothetical protein
MVDIQISYSSMNGYPESVYIDFLKCVANEELSFLVFQLEPQLEPAQPQEGLAPVAEWQSGLDTAKSSWEEVGLVAYTYIYQRSCECLPEDTAPKVVEVVDGVVISVDGQPVHAVERSGNDDNIPTIEGLFKKIQGAIGSDAFRVDVQYDGELGYPLSIYIDYYEDIADEELIISATLTAPSTGIDFPNLEQGADAPSHSPTSSPATESASTAGLTDESSGSAGINVACWGWLALFALNFCQGQLL